MKTIFLMFGSNGDLAKKKLFPAIYDIYDNYNQDIDVIGLGRKKYDQQSFKDYIKNEVSYFFSNQNNINNFCSKIQYSQLDITNPEDFYNLKKAIENIDNGNSQLIIYLSVSPEYYFDFIENSKILDLKENTKVIFEKPFGVDLKSAENLEQKIKEVFTEEQTYIIDHYLGKEPIQNLLAFRFANTIFEPVWNNNYIDNIQILATEDIDVGSRGSYYEKAGALRDMVQNHLMQVLSLVTMDFPAKLDYDSISAEKLKVLKSINLGENLNKNLIFGQYNGYKQEEGVDKNSKVETFVAMKLEIKNFRFIGVPIYLKTGKALDKKSTKIVINFKKVPNIFQEFGEILENRIIIEVQPNEGINIDFNIKEEGNKKNIQRVHSSFKNETNTKEAYQKLIEDVIKGDKSLFTSFDILKQSWKIVDKIVNCKKDCPKLYNYEKGTSGPEESNKLLEKDGINWHE